MKFFGSVIVLLLLVGYTFSFDFQWRYGLSNQYERMSFGASPAIADLGSDVNSTGGEPNQFMEIITGSDEYGIYVAEEDTNYVGVWRCIDAFGNLEWLKDTRTDESRSSVAVLDFINTGDDILEIAGGTTSGWNVEALDRFGDIIWTFPSPPKTSGPFMWHSSPAVADIVPESEGLEIVIGNNPCNSIFCFQADPFRTAGIDDGINYIVEDYDECFYDYSTSGGTDGINWDVLWFYETVGPVISTPAVGDINNDGDLDVVFGDGYAPTYSISTFTGGKIYCLDGPTGALRWIVNTGGAQIVEASPALADFDGDDDLESIVGAFDSMLYLIDGDEDDDGFISASEMITYPMSDVIKSSCAIGDVNGDGEYEIIACDMGGKVVCLSYNPPDVVSLLWETMLDAAIVSSPALAGENTDPTPWTHFCANPQRTNFYPISGEPLYIFVASLGGILYNISGETGEILDSIRIGKNAHTSPVIADIDLDCQYELVMTACDTFSDFIPDTIVCLNTGLLVQDCRICGDFISRKICPVDEFPVFVSCPQQEAIFVFAETTYWDYPDTLKTYITVDVQNDGESYTLNLMGGSNRVNFQNILYDTFQVSIWHNWNNGDTVTIVLDSLISNGECRTTVSESIEFIIDLEPPTISVSPPPGIISAGELSLDITLEDELAGVRWTSVYAQPIIVHPDGNLDTLSTISDLDSVRFEDLQEDDTLLIYVRACDSIPEYECTCEPNCTVYTLVYPIAGAGPIAEPVLPQGISACVQQQIWIALTDSDGVDSTTITALINGDTFSCADTCLDYSNDTLFFIPPESFWDGVETVQVELISADDLHGNTLANPLEWIFYLDFEPPDGQMTTPEPFDTIINIHHNVEIEFSDNFAGVWLDSSWLQIDALHSLRIDLSEIIVNIDEDSLFGEIIFQPENFSMVWIPGETVDVYLHLCDKPDTCGPNCADFQWRFFIMPNFGCSRMPNPFTPNSDEINDYCQFTFPGLLFKKANIFIYDKYGILVRDISITPGADAKQSARWDGKDYNGKNLPQGLYIYIVEVDGEIVCEGTVTIAR